MKLPTLTITKAMYDEAKQVESIREDIWKLKDSSEIKFQLSRKINDLIEKYEDYFFSRISAHAIVREYERREKNTEVSFDKLKDRNTYRFILKNGTAFESKLFSCIYRKDSKKAFVLSEITKPISFEMLDGNYEEVICIERNNNLDYKNDDWWNEKLLLYSNILNPKKSETTIKLNCIL